MALQVNCPACRKPFVLERAEPGQVVLCPHCQTKMTLSGKPPPQPGGSGSVPKVIGRFEVRERLGAGAFGTVYKAYDARLDRFVALKVPQPGVMEQPGRADRFLREARLAAKLRHPNIVPVYEADHSGGLFYIASAFIEGATLEGLIDRGPIELEQAVRMTRELAEALAYAHGQNVVHRDVKPANVMVDKTGAVLLMDFGLAHGADQDGHKTRDGAVLGTPSYMAPEQAEGKKGGPLAASDQYSLGVIFYELLTGKPPFEGPIATLIYHAVHTPPPPPRSLRKTVPGELERVCLKALSKRPVDRYPSCLELAGELRRWEEGPRKAAPPVAPVAVPMATFSEPPPPVVEAAAPAPAVSEAEERFLAAKARRMEAEAEEIERDLQRREEREAREAVRKRREREEARRAAHKARMGTLIRLGVVLGALGLLGLCCVGAYKGIKVGPMKAEPTKSTEAPPRGKLPARK